MSNFDTVFSTAPRWTNIEDISSANNTAINALHLGAEMQKKAFDSFAGAGNQVFDKAQKQQALEIQKAIDALSVNELANTAKTQADIDKLVLDKFQDIGGASAQTQADIYKALSNAYPERVKQEDAVTTLKTNQLAYKQKEQDNVYKQHGTPAIQQYQQLRSISDLLIATEAKLADPNLTDEGKQKLTAQLQQATAAQTILEESFNQTISNMGEYGEAFVLNIDEHVANHNKQKEEEEIKNKELVIKAYTPWAKEKAYSMYGSFMQALTIEDKAEQQKQISHLMAQISDVPSEVQDMVLGNVYKILQDEGRYKQAAQLDKQKLEIENKKVQQDLYKFTENLKRTDQGLEQEQQKIDIDTLYKVAQIENMGSDNSGGSGSTGDGKGKGRPAFFVKDPQTKQWTINSAKFAQELNNKMKTILNGSDAYNALLRTNDGGTLSVTDFHKKNKEKLTEDQQKLYEDLKDELALKKHGLSPAMQLHALHAFIGDMGNSRNGVRWWNDLTIDGTGEPKVGFDYRHKLRLAGEYTAIAKKQLAENQKQSMNALLSEYIESFTNAGFSPNAVRQALADGGIDRKALNQITPFLSPTVVEYFGVTKIPKNTNTNNKDKNDSTKQKARAVDELLKNINSTNGSLR